MLNYSSIIQILKSDGYVDRTDSFLSVNYHEYISLENCGGTGSSFFLKSLASFLDKTIDTKAVFQNLKIGKSPYFSKEINSYRVLWMDFSDFNADSYELAIDYLRKKMSDTYKFFYKTIESESDSSFISYSLEDVLDIIEQKSSIEVLQDSLRNLLLKLRGYEMYDESRKLAFLIDNLVQLETVSKRNGYSKEMSSFLKSFIVPDVYKYSDLFLQIGDCPEGHKPYFYDERFLTYHNFSISSSDLRKQFPRMVVEKEQQQTLDYQPYVPENIDWSRCVADGRKRIRKKQIEEELLKQKRISNEKKRYAVDLASDIPLLSPNLGIRKKKLDKNTRSYAELNALVKEIYSELHPELNANNIYKYFQKFNNKELIINDIDSLKTLLDSLTEENSNWRKSDTSGSNHHWIQVIYRHKDDNSDRLPIRPTDLKVYAYYKQPDVQNIFVESLKFLLGKAGNTFAAKIGRHIRSDQMCYWISPQDFNHLENFFRPYFKDMVKSLPFVAYKGMLGISKDFQGLDYSHNSTQAYIISDYLKTVRSVDDVDLEDMYNNYIAKWNAEVYEEDTLIGFKNNSALSFIVILDSIDVILSGTDISCQSLLLSGDKLWNILAKSRCWADLNEKWIN